MVLRVEPSSERASLLSLPRDLWVPLGERRQPAHQQRHPERRSRRAGRHDRAVPRRPDPPLHPGRLRRLPGPRRGDRRRGRCTSRPRRATPTPSSTSTTAGCVTLDGHQALAYVRSRHYQYYEDGRWRTDPSGDLGRISRQQDFIIRALHQAVAQGARNPLTLDRLVDAGLDTVTVDDLLTADDIISLGRAFRSFEPELARHLRAAHPSRVRRGLRRSCACRTRRPSRSSTASAAPTGGDLQPRDVRVLVLNGSGLTGQAGQTSAALAAAGFGAAGTGEADRFDVTETLVRYTPGNEAKADLVARYLDPSARLELVEGTARRRRRGRHRHPPHRGPRRAPAAGPVDHRQHHHDHGRAATSTTTASSTSTTTRPRSSATCPRPPRASTAEPTAPTLRRPAARVGATDLPDWLLHGRLPLLARRRRAPRARGGARDEGDRARRRAGHPPEPRQPGHVEAAHARLRQAARLLPDQHPAARPHQRDPDHLEPRAAAAVRGAPRRRPPAGGAGSATPSSPCRTASRRPS